MTKKILLLGANERACFSVAKNLHQHGYSVDVAHWGNHEIALSKFVTDFHVLPELETDLLSFYTAFSQLVSTTSFWLVLPINDLAVEFLNRYRAELEKYTIVGGINGAGTIRFSQNKYELWKICRELGINTPGTTLVTSLSEFDRAKSSLQYPVIAKPVSSRKIIGNRIYSFTVRKFSTEEPLEDFVRERILSIPIMLQEIVNGFGIGFNFLSKDGQLIAYYMHERITEPRGGGESSYRKTITEDKYDIVEKSKRLIEHIKWNGVGMIEYKVSEGKAYIMELNGRFWGSIELGIFADMEIPYWQVKYNYEKEPLPAQVITCTKEVYARNLRNDLLSTVKEKSIKSVLKWISTAPKMFRSKERVEDSLFTDFRFRWTMWTHLIGKGVKGLWQKWNQKSMSLQTGAPVYKKYTKVLFICEGNICRSPFAEKYLKKINPSITVASCGFQYQASKMSPLKAIQAAKEEGVDLSGHRSAYIGDVNAGQFDALFIMDKKNYQKLKKKYPELTQKTFFLDQQQVIIDPYGGSATDFKNCYTTIKQVLDQNFI